MYKANWLNSKSPLAVYFNSALSALGLYGCKNFFAKSWLVERNKVTVFINTVAYDLQPYPSNGQQPDRGSMFVMLL